MYCNVKFDEYKLLRLLFLLCVCVCGVRGLSDNFPLLLSWKMAVLKGWDQHKPAGRKRENG